MYGLWLFKEIRTEYGYCKVEIYRKGYTASAIEIGALVGNSLSLALENLDTITAPIGKSVCSFEIYDTDQVEYDELFTPDATAYKVVISTKVGEGAYVTRWSGYITPDFFSENLSYRTPISISARDNIGYLNDVDFDMEDATTTVRGLIQAAFKRIAEDYPMSLSFVTQKQTAEGVLAVDATISTMLFREGSWYEAIETILHDLGLQMRWVDNNTIAVIDVSQIPEYYGKQGFKFIGGSGYREILPAWRELSQEQDFGLRENFFEGWMRSKNLTFTKEIVIRPPNATMWTSSIACYIPNNYGVARNAFTTDPEYYGSSFGKKLYFSGVDKDNPYTSYLSWRQVVQPSNKPMKFQFKAFNSVIYPGEKYSNSTTPSGRKLEAYNPVKWGAFSEQQGDFVQIGLKINLLLHSGLDTYVLRNQWEKVENGEDTATSISFVLPKVELSYIKGNDINGTEPSEQDVTVDIATIPYAGELELRIYGYYIVNKHNYWEDDWSLNDYNFDWEKCLCYINEPIYTFNNEDAQTGQDSKVQIAELHNIKTDEDYIFGQVPLDCGGINAYAGGLFDNEGRELIGFQRNANATNYNLLELVGREIIHFNKKNYNKLSGTIRNLNKEPLMFNRLFTYNGKNYAPFAYSLDVISNEMNITTMQEVEPYVTADLAAINSVMTTGGSTVGGGNNTILQYSQDAGNTKRIYELTAASEEEKKDAWLMLDNISFPEARKVNIKDLVGLDENKLIIFLDENNYTTEEWVNKALAPLGKAIETNAANIIAINERVTILEALGLELKGDAQSGYYIKAKYSFVTEGEVISGRRASGATTDVGGGGLNVNAMWEQLGLYDNTKIIDASHIPTEFVTETELSNKGYATQSWVSANYLGLGGGMISGGLVPLSLNSNTSAISMRFGVGGVAKVELSWDNSEGLYFYNYVSSSFIGIKNDGTPNYNGNTLYHSGNFNPADYLPKSGGTINAVEEPLTILRNMTGSASYIIYKNGDEELGRLGFYGGWNTNAYEPFFSDKNGVNRIILHSNNYSSYALPLSGGTLTSSEVVVLGLDATNDIQNAFVLYHKGVMKTQLGYVVDIGSYIYDYSTGIHLGIDTNGAAYCGSAGVSSSEHHLLIHSGNIGSYNAGSATKLQTARTIWGQSFDGSANIDTTTYGMMRWLYFSNSSGVEQGYVGRGSDTNDIYLATYGENSLHFSTNNSMRATITPSGNVLIGTTNDRGYKLDVDGSTCIRSGNNWSSAQAYALKVIQGTDNGSGLYDTMIITSNDVVTLRLSEEDGTQIGICAGDHHTTFTSTHDFRFYTDVAPNQPVYGGGGGNFKVGINYRDTALFVNGDFTANGNATFGGDIVASGEVISSRRASASDARLKDNITTLTADNCLNIARQLKPTEWNWKTDGKHSFGFIAQDVNNILPCAVTAIKDAVLGERLNLQYDQLIAIAIGGVQGVDDKVTRLENEVSELRDKLQKYELRYGYN